MFTKFLFLFVFRILTVFSQESKLHHDCLPDKGNFAGNSTYSSNLKTLLSNFSSLPPNESGHYEISVGQNNDKINGVALCRGDVKGDSCVSCIRTASNQLHELCPMQIEPVIWFDNCMFRYSNRSIFDSIENIPRLNLANGRDASEKNEFDKDLRNLLDLLRARAAAGGSIRKYATGKATGPAFQYIYGLVQCIPDMTEVECNDCLIEIFVEIPRCCDGKEGGRVAGPSCNFRYEIYRFFNNSDTGIATLSPSVSPFPPPTINETANVKGKEIDSSRTVMAVVLSVLAFIVVVICLCIFLRKRKRKPKNTIESESKAVDGDPNSDSLLFDFNTIKNATNDFSDENMLGQGGFGAVYRGKLSDGQEIAVKRLAKNSSQGDSEFKNEALLLAKLQHRNLVRLLGFCIKNNERLLVYEFVFNASLDNFIFDSIKRVQLNWEKRYTIIGGVARGLLYLHEDSRLRIIHRDMKASNILLDTDMTPKIADFGLAKLVDVDQTQAATSRIAGTYGYMAPEYVMYGHFSVKTDVFSFGVLVLEIVTGQKNTSFRFGSSVEILIGSVWRCWKDGTIMDMVDPSLTYSSSTDIIKCIHIGLLCVEDNVAHRPTMGAVVVMLSSNSLTLRAPAQPAFVQRTTKILSDVSSSMQFSSTTTTSRVSKSELLPLSMNEDV